MISWTVHILNDIVDVELVVHVAAVRRSNYDAAAIVNGNSYFYCLAEYLQEKNKLLRIIAPNKKYSKLLRGYRQYITSLEQLQAKLEYVSSSNKKPARAVETLGLPRYGDTVLHIAKSAKAINGTLALGRK